MLSYSPGSWNAVVTPTGAALLAPDVPADTLRAMWQAMSASEGLGPVLESLVGSFGTSLSSLPSFAVAFYDADADEIRVMVRGPVHARVSTAASATQEFSGLGVTTWSERVVASPGLVELTGVLDSGVELPIRDGVVAAGRLRWIVSGEDADTIEPQTTDAAVIPAVAERAPRDEAPDAELIPDPVHPVAERAERDEAPESEPEPAPAPTVAERAERDEAPQPESQHPVAERAERDEAPAPAPAPAPEPAPVVAETVAPHPGETHAQPPALTVVHDDPVSDATTGYDDLIFGETRISTVEDAAVRVAPEEDAPPPAAGLISGIPAVSAPPAPPAEPAGDHDGETISAAQLAAIQAELAQRGTAGAAPAASAASAASAVPAQPAPPAPPAAVAPTLVVSTGERFALDRGAVIGRRPRAVRATGVVPHLVTVASPNQDISRSHVELRVESGDVMAADLDTTNGTRLLRVGAEPVRLHPGEPSLLVPGDRLDLGDGIVLAFEGLR